MWIYHPLPAPSSERLHLRIIYRSFNPQAAGTYFTLACGPGVISNAVYHSKSVRNHFTVNDKRMLNKIKHLYTHHFDVRNCHPSVAKGWFSLWSDDSFRHLYTSKWWLLIFYLVFLSFLVIYLNVKWFDQFFFKILSLSPVLLQNGSFIGVE